MSAPPFDLAAIGRGLPFAGALGQLRAALERTGSAVVQAPPGTGKTTLVPPLLANECGRTLVVAPRRVAVRAAARRLRQLSRTAEGQVGFRMRGASEPGALVEFVTPGVMLRLLLADPSLEGVAAVAVDEVHERHLDTDLALGMLIELAAMREDFRLVAMSATLAAADYAALIGAEVVATPAVTHPLEITYAPHPGRVGGEPAFWRHLAHLAEDAVARTGDAALVFVPGVREIDQVIGEITREKAVALHGRLDDQEAALTSGRRIVVATAVAESSLTVPGVRIVVDSGLARVPRRDAARGMTGLVTVSEARSTAQQRAGRAGREGPGLVIRAFRESEYAHFPAEITPEILTADLTQAELWLRAWGSPDDLPLLDAPPAPARREAAETLRALGALTPDGGLTKRGRRLAGLPLDPRLGAALLAGGPAAAGTVAALAEGMPGDLTRARGRDEARLRRLVSGQGEAGKEVASISSGKVIALAYPTQVARRDTSGDGRTFLLASGTRAVDAVGLTGEWIAVAEVTRSRGAAGAVIRAGAELTQEEAEDVVGVTETLRATVRDGKLRGTLVRALGAIELSATPVPVDPEIGALALAETVRREGLGMFRWSAAAAQLRDRLAFLHARLGEPWPDLASLDPLAWLEPELERVAHGAAIERVDLLPALQRVLPWPEATRLDELAPTKLAVPSGSHPALDYATGRPVVRVKLQECFGLAESPVIGGERVQFRLLSPAGRELAVTDDLSSFWSGPYQGVRAEMRGRYPKHPWPADPWTAPATAKTTNRLRREGR